MECRYADECFPTDGRCCRAALGPTQDRYDLLLRCLIIRSKLSLQ